MNAHTRHLHIDLDGFLIIDMEDRLNCSFCTTEAEARDVYRQWPGDASLRVIRMADGRHHDVTVDFIPDEDGEPEFIGAEHPSSLLRWYQSRVL